MTHAMCFNPIQFFCLGSKTTCCTCLHCVGLCFLLKGYGHKSHHKHCMRLSCEGID